MTFEDFQGTNKTFTKPANMTDDQCGALKVRQAVHRIDGEPFAVSTSGWKPDANDLERLNAGGLVFLNIFGIGHPVVSITTELIETEPFPEAGGL